MELKLERGAIDVCRTIASCSAKQPFDTDLTLPDYCGDIKRILHCGVQPQLRSVSAADERAAAQGEITVRLLYLNEQNEPDCLEQTLPLSVHCRCGKGGGDAVWCAAASAEYVNCRAVSPRKVQLDGSVTVHFEAYEKQAFSFVQTAEQCETQTQQIACSRMTAAAQKTFDLSETVALDDAEPPVAAIVQVIGTPLLQSTEAVDDKLLVKGELRLEIICLSQDKKIRRVSHTLPLSQVMEAPGLRGGDALDVSLRVQALYAGPKRDADDAQRLLDLAAKVSAQVKAFRDDSVQVVSDCYATQGTLVPTFSDCRFARAFPLLPAQLNERQRTDTGVRDGALLFASVAGVQTEATFRDDAFLLKHHVTMDLLIRGGEDDAQYLTQTVDLEQTVPAPDELTDPVFTPETTVLLDGAHLSQDGTLEAALSVSVSGTVYDGTSQRILTDAACSDSEEAQTAQLILAFCAKGEDLWSICKRYRTPVGVVKAENALDDDLLPEDRMLLIPAAT